METTAAFEGLACRDCGTVFDPAGAGRRCGDCGGTLTARYDTDELAVAHERLPEEDGRGLERYAPVLPFPAETLVTLNEGGTPLVSCPDLADQLGVDSVTVKDEARNPTGDVADRGMALAVTAARETGASAVALPTTGNGGQSAAAYASRAGLASHSFVPSRTTFQNKAMINVHGGEMNVVGGRYPDAEAAFKEAITDEDWHSLAPFETPFRQEGLKTLAYELAEQAPDAVVCPTGHGTTIVGFHRGFSELAEAGVIAETPRLYAAQAAGCAPIATAWEDGASDTDPVDHPDTISGPLEMPDPAGGRYVLDALEETGGAAIGTPDSDMLEDALALAQAGVPTSATAGAALAGAKTLAQQGAFDADESVVLVNPTTTNREADLLRSRLMSKGV